jgi:hypothetical protein
MLRHIGKGGVFKATPRSLIYEQAGVSVLSIYDPTLFRSELELADNNSSSKKLKVGLAGLFRRGNVLTLSMIIGKNQKECLVHTYEFVPNDHAAEDKQNIFHKCLTDRAGNSIARRKLAKPKNDINPLH